MTVKHDLPMRCGTTCKKRANQEYVRQLELENKRVMCENANLTYEHAQMSAVINIDGYNYKVYPEVFNLIEHLQLRLKQCGKH